MKSRIMLWSLILLIGWAIPTGAQEPQVDPLQGEAVYQAHCVGCHGVQGKGDGPDAATLIVPPANFQRMESRAKSETDLRAAIIWDWLSVLCTGGGAHSASKIFAPSRPTSDE